VRQLVETLTILTVLDSTCSCSKVVKLARPQIQFRNKPGVEYCKKKVVCSSQLTHFL